MRYHRWAAVLFGLLLVTMAGCSDHNPVGPLSTSQTASVSAVTGDSLQFAARVRTTDQNRCRLTLAGCCDTVVAAHNCEIVRLNGDTTAPIPFAHIAPWDSVGVHGVRQQNGEVLAYRLQVFGDSCFDVAFRDTIVTIDYTAGSFTVTGRSETILVDANTIIWRTMASRMAMYRERYANEFQIANPATDQGPPGYWTERRDTALAFTDLMEGDIVEVKAQIIDASTLLAVAIKLAGCSDAAGRCVKFEASLATIDVPHKAVTFTGLAWIGIVGKGASLTDADGTPITLADFAVGDLVAVKGYPLEADSLKVCQMQKL